MATTEPRWMTTDQLCQLLQISRRTIYRWRNAEGFHIPGEAEFGGTLRFDRAAVEAWMEQGAPRPRAAEASARQSA